jgi:hypothetical protein
MLIQLLHPKSLEISTHKKEHISKEQFGTKKKGKRDDA